MLSRLYVRSSIGRLVPLETVARVSRTTQALTVNHQGQLPSVTISFNLLPGVSLGDAVNQIKAMEREVSMPASLNTSLQGTAQAFQSSLQGSRHTAADRSPGGLSRAGHPLRELRAS